MRNINLKKGIFFGLVFLFVFITIIAFIPTKNYNYKNIIKNREENKDLVKLVLINDKMAAFDRDEKTLYFPSEYLLNNMKIEIESAYLTNNMIIKENNTLYLLVYSKKNYQKIPIVITKLPIINIVYKDNKSISYFPLSVNNDLGSLYSYNNDYFDVEVELMGTSSKKWIYKNVDATLNLRGASSAYFHSKKSYRLKFNKNINMFNIYKDDVFVLDALSTDKSKIRNILSSDMWNLINDNQDIDNDLVGDYVEVFVNGYYKGLYIVKNKVNKKTVDLGKNGLIIKDIHKNNEYFINELINYKNYAIGMRGYFLNYQIKKYNEEAFESFIEKLKAYYKNGATYNNINKNFDLDNYLNYLILVILIDGDDNIIYNKYYSLKNPNSKILLTPWDMDLTWGLWWSYTEDSNSHFDMETSIDKGWVDNKINEYTDNKTYKFLRKRYWELRKTSITNKTINDYIDKYEKEIITSKAYERDSKRYYNYDIRSEIKKIRKWSKLRLAFLDDYFK